MAPTTTSKLVTEFIGTFFLVFIIGLCVTRGIEPGTTPPAIAIGVGLTVLVYMGGHISGAHYNPAVTLAIFLRGKIDAALAAFYMLVQFAGAVVATLAVKGITGVTLAIAPGDGVTVHSAGVGITSTTAVAVEAMCTFLLALVVLNVATSKNTAGNSYYGFAIGGTVLACAAAAGGISGGAFNPAVGVGPALAVFIHGGGFPSHAWIYLVGPFLGGAAAAMVFRIQKQD